MSFEFEYFYGNETEQFSFYRIPKMLFKEKMFKDVSAEAKVLYGLMLDRTGLSAKNGWIDEVKLLIENNIEVSLIKEIGYNDIYRYLNGELEIDEVVNKIKQDTRHYAKRQITWFKNKMNCIEIINDNNAFDKICKLIDEFIK